MVVNTFSKKICKFYKLTKNQTVSFEKYSYSKNIKPLCL